MPKQGESIIEEESQILESIINNNDLSDIQLLNEYEKKISKDIVELEKKMQEFKKWESIVDVSGGLFWFICVYK